MKSLRSSFRGLGLTMLMLICMAGGALAVPVSLTGAPLEAAWAPPTLRLDKLDKGTRILVDGKLSEPAWATATQTGAFVNVATGKADPKQAVQGSAKLLWDDKALYVAFDVADKDVIGGFKKTDKDPQLWTKDTVEIMIDPDGNNLARLTSGDRPGRKVNSENPSWGPTGRHVAFASNETGNYAIYVMTIDGLVRRRISPANLECSTPSWGPSEG